ncbi:hypothetical protein CYLTODRAFT_417236 [Cylindrobasidium torrendii FP15055 ss-10]|uniref:Uncharacterized protein n=1 Tax=Cylindrobasidium torrendii FP15055 ss-10 TaxID=1314674 RepID=A0A0D7BRX1_9AGAR|nr:hypothetical protein CYLTODRAFT_417236 [Cylindrobasidium torrendii FP15055 ss-10]
MSTATARAEARRKAILSRGSDRLAKLTTSGRGEDAPAYMHDDPPLAKLNNLSKFVGEETTAMPPQFSAAPPDPTVWNNEEQQRLMQALLMGGFPQMQPGQAPALGTPPRGDSIPSIPSMEDNPLFAQLAAAMPPPGSRTAMDPPKPKTLVQRLFPLIHLVSAWILLAYFVLVQEPNVNEAMGGFVDEQKNHAFTRWGAFSKEIGRVQVVPFFWAFTTVQIIIHSTRLSMGFDSTPLPTLLSMAMPVLPPTLSTIVVHGYKYIGLFSMLLDDIAALLVGIGFFVWISTWFSA